MDAQVPGLQILSTLPYRATRESRRDFKEAKEACDRRWAVERMKGSSLRGFHIRAMRPSEMRLGKWSKLGIADSEPPETVRINWHNAYESTTTHSDPFSI